MFEQIILALPGIETNTDDRL